MEKNEEQLKNLMHNICALRSRYGLTKKDMAKLLGISRYYLNKIERGEFPE